MNIPAMRRFLAAAAALLLLLLGSQAVLAQYQPTGSLSITPQTQRAGGVVVVAGDGFAPGSPVRITIGPVPTLLATVTADAAGTFSAGVTIPSGASGQQEIAATGVDSNASVRVLSATVTILGTATPPATNSGPVGDGTVPSDAFVFALAAGGIVILTAGLLFVVRRPRSNR